MTSGGYNYNIYLIIVYFFNTSVFKHLRQLKTACFPALVSYTWCSVLNIMDAPTVRPTTLRMIFGKVCECMPKFFWRKKLIEILAKLVSSWVPHLLVKGELTDQHFVEA
jgi:hypothetical protein